MLEKLREAYEIAMLEFEQRRKQETNDLMAEIESFHIQNAIDIALATNNKEAFLQLTGGEQP